MILFFTGLGMYHNLLKITQVNVIQALVMQQSRSDEASCLVHLPAIREEDWIGFFNRKRFLNDLKCYKLLHSLLLDLSLNLVYPKKDLYLAKPFYLGTGQKLRFLTKKQGSWLDNTHFLARFVMKWISSFYLLRCFISGPVSSYFIQLYICQK